MCKKRILSMILAVVILLVQAVILVQADENKNNTVTNTISEAESISTSDEDISIDVEVSDTQDENISEADKDNLITLENENESKTEIEDEQPTNTPDIETQYTDNQAVDIQNVQDEIISNPEVGVQIGDEGPYVEVTDNSEAEFDNKYVDGATSEQMQVFSNDGINPANLQLFTSLDINSVYHKSIVTGNTHVLMVNSNGTVSAWGENIYGQLGNDTTQNSNEPVTVQGLSDIIEVSAGDGYSIALDKNGDVYSWGRNSWGVLGLGNTSINTNIPNKIDAFSEYQIIKISTSGYHCLALDSDGNVYSWGTNANGQLGVGDESSRTIPTKIETLPSMVDISAGGYFSLAVDYNGNVWGWGNNNDCRLGILTGGNYNTPQMTDKSDIVYIVTGYDHCMVLDKFGSVYTWGANRHGELGVTGITTYTPQKQNPGLSDIKNVFLKCHHNIVVNVNNETYSWGRNEFGQLGIGSNEANVYVPTKVCDIDFKTLASNDVTTYAIDEKYNLYRWGYMSNTNISNYSNGSSIPLDISFKNKFVQIDSKRNSVVALDENGDVYTWGDGAYWDLGHGIGNNSNLYYPKIVEGLPKIVEVAKGKNHTLALDEDGYIWGWGNNSSGELGSNLKGKVYVPTQISGISNATKISAGEGFSVALVDGAIWTWGTNGYGQLGNKTVANGTPGIGIDVGSNRKQIDVDCGESFVVSKTWYDDPFYELEVGTWGRNNSGQLGWGLDEYSANLSTVSDIYPNEIDMVSAGREHALGLTYYGSVYSWGRNSVGQLGFGDKINRNRAELIPNLENIKFIDAAYGHSIAIDKEGSLYIWGEGREGQMGNGKKETSRIPVKIDSINNAKSASGSNDSTYVIDTNGKLLSFGSNVYGQLGVISFDPVIVMYGSSKSSETQKKFIFELNAGAKVIANVTGKNIVNFTGRTFTIKYDSDNLEVVDLIARSQAFETMANAVYRDIKIIQSEPGIIKFETTKLIPSNKIFNGYINGIKFKAKNTCQTTIYLEY